MKALTTKYNRWLPYPASGIASSTSITGVFRRIG
jgi:hypothetical protein